MLVSSCAIHLLQATDRAEGATASFAESAGAEELYPRFHALRFGSREGSAEHDGPLPHGFCNFGRKKVLQQQGQQHNLRYNFDLHVTSNMSAVYHYSSCAWKYFLRVFVWGKFFLSSSFKESKPAFIGRSAVLTEQ